MPINHKTRKEFVIYKIGILEASINSLKKSFCGTGDLQMELNQLHKELQHINEQNSLEKRIEQLETQINKLNNSQTQ